MTDSEAQEPPLFAEEDEVVEHLSDPVAGPGHGRGSGPGWKVLVVDDEQGVHDVTLLALRHQRFLGRQLEFLHAHSGQDARLLFQQHDDIAVAFIDVVMEADDAGLSLVDYVRNELGNFQTRLVLRTGQPGLAPESKVIEQYDINDYKDKTELTKQKLTTTLFTALRSYRDIVTLEQNRQGLEQVVKATSSIYSLQDFDHFVSGLLTQVLAVVGANGDALCAQSSGLLVGCCGINDPGAEVVVAATGTYADHLGKPIEEVVTESELERIRESIRLRQNGYFDDGSVFFIHDKMDGYGIVYINTRCLQEDGHRKLLELFSSNITIAYENISLNREIEDTQREIIFTLGTIAEFRSQETSDHVKRVAEYTEILARGKGLDNNEIELLKMASPLHDLGKLAIPDAVLNKPGKLTAEEFELMKTHTTRGYEMLRHSKRPLLECAAVIAQSHQEKWDGTGYPKGLAGEEIPLHGRIVAIADVFDALDSDRCYKKAWDIDAVFAYFTEQRGLHFDPQLVDLLFEHRKDFLAVREKYQQD